MKKSRILIKRAKEGKKTINKTIGAIFSNESLTTLFDDEKKEDFLQTLSNPLITPKRSIKSLQQVFTDHSCGGGGGLGVSL
jgi:hypothetical protein